MLRITIVVNANAVNMSFAMDAKRNVEALNAQIANNLKETIMCKYDEAFTEKEMLEETGFCKCCKLDCPNAGKSNTEQKVLIKEKP